MDPHAAHLAVLAGEGDRESGHFELSRGEFHGTAFCLAPHLFITAAHVYDAAKASGQVAVARLTPGRYQAQTARDAEVFGDIDLAILLCPNLAAEVLPFSFAPLNYFSDVFSMGYAFGLEVAAETGEPHVNHLRAFRGHVMTRRGITQLPGVPAGYEVSFIPPPGLSGAALLTPQSGEGLAVTGVVIKHHTAELEERRMDLGLAVDSEELLTLDSRLVGGSIAERLFRRPRVPPRDRRP